MKEKIIIAGAGGQGIMLLGKVLAESAMRQGKFVTWLPAYGAEVRGGTAYCMVVVSDAQISSPVIDKADSLIVMNQPSLDKFLCRLKNKGFLVLNSSLAVQPQSKIFKLSYHPFTDIAVKLGNIKVANMVAMASYLAKNNLLDFDTVNSAIIDMAPKDKPQLAQVNQEAIREGRLLR
jgi:2-oxoglutarate ferredoxin oxidoreductase subunit gamma